MHLIHIGRAPRSDVNKDLGPKAKAKAKDLDLKAKAKDLRCQSQ